MASFVMSSSAAAVLAGTSFAKTVSCPRRETHEDYTRRLEISPRRPDSNFTKIYFGQPMPGLTDEVCISACLFDELTGLTAFAADKAFGLDLRLPCGRDDDFDDLAHAAPPTVTVNLMEPSTSDCSVTV